MISRHVSLVEPSTLSNHLRSTIWTDGSEVVWAAESSSVLVTTEGRHLSSEPRSVSLGYLSVLSSMVCFHQVYLDQALFAPGIIAFYFGAMTALEGKGVGEAFDRISNVCDVTRYKCDYG